jgi:RimJ/RimL family protein N-acetyltransferase
MKDLRFLPIDLNSHSELCLQFRADSFMESFGTTNPFYEDDGLGGEKYLAWLKTRPNARYSVFHVWLDLQIIGQLELGERNPADDFGYVHLYYLAPEWRGKGYSELLDTFAMNYIKTLGYQKVRLSVSPTNLRALGFYKKQGWVEKGERKEAQLTQTLKFPLQYMEKKLC